MTTLNYNFINEFNIMRRSNCLILIFICFINCCNGQKQNYQNLSTDNKKLELREYVFENDTISQKARIIFMNKNQILFTINTINKKRNFESIFSDTAYIRNILGVVNIQAYDDEIIGDMYPAVEYIYNKKFYLSIGIDNSIKGRLFILEADGSEKYRNKYCPYNSLGTLRKIKN